MSRHEFYRHVGKQRNRRARPQTTGIGTLLLLPIAGLAIFGLVKPGEKASGAMAFSQSATAPAGAYYRYCDEARAAGMAPLYRGKPGYRPQLDRDGDGVACEPYNGR